MQQNKDSLVDRFKARLMDPKLNENFTNRVNKPKNITVEDKRKYALADEGFQEYKKLKK